ncbi:MAG TPA: ComEC/Rec2 family competence protein [Xanthobacteraceae bacterium]|nr:ComEC/Rec2 family competence protein [Xanthobacteraceae bacterium]
MASSTGTGGQAAIWPQAAARLRRPFTWPGADLAYAAGERIRAWGAAEVAPGRLMPWLPVAFGSGVVVYFAADREPAWWAAISLALTAAAITVLVRARPIAFAAMLALTSAAVGFATVTLRSFLIAHPVLHHVAGNVQIAGFVEVREERERSDRIVVRVVRIEGGRLDEAPERVRLAVRKGKAPPVGAYVTLRARLAPPLAPVRPGGYDFARDLYFQHIGASGFVLGAINVAEPPVKPSRWLQVSAVIQGMRDAIDARIRSVLEGDTGAIASALITGKRDAISKPVHDAMYVSSLAHVLSISGYHMAVVAGVVFFVCRALLALIPGFANRRPIKKWAAVAALLAAGFYLVLSGAEVATQRAFIMAAIVLIGVMADRAALTLRNLAIAAFVVLLVTPEAVVHPSFQMSFAATLALVAAYERGMPWTIAGADTSLGARAALWGGREVAALILASLVAGLATAPFAAFHFHRIAPYGVLANLFAMPIVSLWVMPSGLLGLVLVPFGFDGPLWRIMGEGIAWMVAVAVWVAKLPGAVGRITAFGTGPLLVCALGIVVLALLKTPLRWCGAVLMLAGALWAARAPVPDVLVSADAQTIAVRGGDGRLAILRTGSDRFAAQQWLAADGDGRLPNDTSLAEPFKCDGVGCIAPLANGRLVALARTVAAFEDDCREAAVVVSARVAPPGCAAVVIDRTTVRAHGAVALRLVDDRWVIDVARPAGFARPWARPTAASASEAPSLEVARSRTRDATPRLDDIEPGD